MYYTVDRLEGELAVLETEGKHTVTLPLSELPEGVKERDVLTQEDGAWRVAPDEAERRRQAILQMQARLRRR